MTLMLPIRTDVSDPQKILDMYNESKELALAEICFLQAYAQQVEEKRTLEEKIFAETCVITQAAQALKDLEKSVFTDEKERTEIRCTLRCARQKTQHLRADMMLHEMMPLSNRQLCAYERDMFKTMKQCIEAAIKAILNFVQKLIDQENKIIGGCAK